MRPFGLWIDGRRAYTASNKEYSFLLALAPCVEFGAVHNLAFVAQRSHYGEDAVAFVECGKSLCRLANNLENNSDAVSLLVDVADGEGHALAFVVWYDDDKLSWFPRLGNPRCLDVHQDNVLGQLFAV